MKEELKIDDFNTNNFFVLKKGRELYEQRSPTIAKMIKYKMQEICQERIQEAEQTLDKARTEGRAYTLSVPTKPLKIGKQNSKIYDLYFTWNSRYLDYLFIHLLP